MTECGTKKQPGRRKARSFDYTTHLGVTYGSMVIVKVLLTELRPSFMLRCGLGHRAVLRALDVIDGISSKKCPTCEKERKASIGVAATPPEPPGLVKWSRPPHPCDCAYQDGRLWRQCAGCRLAA
jgi:hypothetical protein